MRGNRTGSSASTNTLAQLTTRAQPGAISYSVLILTFDNPWSTWFSLFLSCSEAAYDGGDCCNRQMDSLGLITGLVPPLVGFVFFF